MYRRPKQDEKKEKRIWIKNSVAYDRSNYFMIMAISVVVIVFGKIHSDYEKLDMTKASEQKTLENPSS